MCELLGMCFNKEVSADFTFRGFVQRSSENPDGWGIALFPEGSNAAMIVKESKSARLSKQVDFIKSNSIYKSSIYLSHIRRATSEIAYANTHPFQRELRGKDYIFAHNGWLKGPYRANLTLGRFLPIGETDSEFAFCHLLNFIENNIKSWDIESFNLLEKALIEINKFGDFNCILSDGEYLFCYRSNTGLKGLFYSKREHPFSNVNLLDEDWNINLRSEKDENEAGYIIATKPLTNETWKELKKGKLTVFRKGEIVHINNGKILDEKLLQVLGYIRKNPTRVDVFILSNAVSVKLDEIKIILKALVNLGYIKQDNRDTAGPYDINASYYTTPNKRMEIDKILEDDKRNHLVAVKNLDCVNARDDFKSNVCMDCLLVYNDDAAFCRNCFSNISNIDTRIVDILFTLNKKGYYTLHSCGGHRLNKHRVYLVITGSRSFEEIPKGFTVEYSKGNTLISSIEYHVAKGISRKKMNQIINDDIFDLYIKENIDNLRDWVRGLPKIC